MHKNIKTVAEKSLNIGNTKRAYGLIKMNQQGTMLQSKEEGMGW
jgi:hypothetical protein